MSSKRKSEPDQDEEEQKQDAPPEEEEPKQEIEEKYKYYTSQEIGEIQPLPENKEQLIQYFTNRLKNAQNILKDTKKLIDAEKEILQSITGELEEKNAQIKQMLVQENRTFTEKVDDSLKGLIEENVQKTLYLEDQNKEFKQIYNERAYMNSELEYQFFTLRKLNYDLKVDIQEVEESNQIQNVKVRQQQNLNVQIQADIEEKNMKIEHLVQEQEELKYAIHNLNDVKNVLNRVQDQPELMNPKAVNKPRPQQQQNNYFNMRKQLEKSLQQSQSSFQDNSFASKFKGPGVSDKNNAFYQPEDDFWYAQGNQGKQVNDPSEGVKLPLLNQKIQSSSSQRRQQLLIK